MFAALRQFLLAFKKLEGACSEKREQAEIGRFLRDDSAKPEPSRFWNVSSYLEEGPDDVLFSSATFLPQILSESGDVEEVMHISDMLECVQRVADLIVCSLRGFPTWRELYPKHGPGVVSDTTRCGKYAFPSWPENLDKMFPYSEFGVPNLNFIDDVDEYGPFCSDAGVHSKLCCVPKDAEKPRLIAAEPCAHMYIQQAIWNHLESRVSKSGLASRFISFRDQTPNQRMALQGAEDRSLATIDLSAASDSVIPLHVEALFNRSVPTLCALRSCRTSYILLPGNSLHPVRMYATSGNATTFPVETLLFLSIALGVVHFIREGKPPNGSRELYRYSSMVRVFGDDIIVPRNDYHSVAGVLRSLGFKPNLGKSFNGGSFRESCGVDAYMGIDVTPSYVRKVPSRKPEVLVALTEAGNNFRRKGYAKTAELFRREAAPAGFPTVAVGSRAFGHETLDLMEVDEYVNSLPQKVSKSWHLRMVKTAQPFSVRNGKKAEGREALLKFFIEFPNMPEGVEWVGEFPGFPRVAILKGWVREADLTVK
jgi:hypothetical protein